MSKQFFEVFPTLQLDKKMKTLLESTIVNRVTSNRAKDILRVYLESGACGSATAQLPVPLAAAIKKMTRPENLKRGIPALIELTHYSQSHLARMLKKHFGLGVKQYINELRLQAAYEEIVFSPKPFAEISEEIGFASLSHFNKIFKARFAITPAALRKNRGYWTT